MKAVKLSAYVVALAFFAASCAQAPDSDEAQVQDAIAEVQSNAGAMQLTIDTQASQVTWIGTKPTGRHNGTFNIAEGSLAIENGTVVGGTIVIDVNSLKVLDIPADDENNAKLTGHLKSGDFFQADQFPNARFEIVSTEPYVAPEGGVEPGADRLADPTHTITGNLTLKDVTKTISFPAKVEISNGSVSAQAKFNIDRTQWNMNYKAEGSVQDNFIHNKVNLGFNIKTQAPANM